ncbi:MAG TPA: hypothetical protein VGE95_03230 [Arthrobacter sp.]
MAAALAPWLAVPAAVPPGAGQLLSVPRPGAEEDGLDWAESAGAGVDDADADGAGVDPEQPARAHPAATAIVAAVTVFFMIPTPSVPPAGRFPAKRIPRKASPSTLRKQPPSCTMR